MPEPSVVVVGSVNADLVVSVAQLPRAGETVTGGTFARHGGGKGANQAVAAARAGAHVAMVGAVGADDLGDEALRELAAEGIDVAAVARLDGVATGVAAIVVDAQGENFVAVASGANAELDAAIVEEAVPRLIGRGSDGVVLLGHEIPEAAVVAGIRAGRDAGWRVVLNPAPARPLVDDLDGVILTPNAHEARALAGEQDAEAAAHALAARTGAPVLVTLGAQGALLVGGDDAAHGESGAPGDDRRAGSAAAVALLPTLAVEVVDTTGAGDAVNGALAAELAAGRPLRDAARFALAAAALSTWVAGARAGMARRDEVLAAL
jgi:ribokinase